MRSVNVEGLFTMFICHKFESIKKCNCHTTGREFQFNYTAKKENERVIQSFSFFSCRQGLR